jgi:hypothetical protein
MAQTSKTPLPGYGVAIIDGSQYENVDFQGDDRFDTPQTGKLYLLNEADADLAVRGDSPIKYKDLLDKKIYWAKYADQDATFQDEALGQEVAFIQLDKLRGYDQ